jgi:hypothetical protein
MSYKVVVVAEFVLIIFTFFAGVVPIPPGLLGKCLDTTLKNNI